MLRVGIVGAGVIGRDHLISLLHVAGARVVGIADPRLEQARELAEMAQATAYGDHQELLDKVDAVWICTPQYLHAEQTVAFAEAGVHVFCEKPIATDLPSADRMIEATRRAGVQLMIGHVIRFYPETIRLKQMVDSGELGEPVYAFGRRLFGSRAWQQSSWRRDVRLTGGATVESSIHEVDTVRWLAGDVASVFANVIHGDPENPEIDTDFRALLKLRSGTTGAVEMSMHTAIRDWSWGVVGTRATAISPRRGELRFARLGEREAQVISVEPVVDPETRVNRSMQAENQAFVDSIRKGAASPVSGEEGRRNLEVILAAYQSARENRVVDL